MKARKVLFLPLLQIASENLVNLVRYDLPACLPFIVAFIKPVSERWTPSITLAPRPQTGRIENVSISEMSYQLSFFVAHRTGDFS
jgi:hypothetical protein